MQNRPTSPAPASSGGGGGGGGGSSYLFNPIKNSSGGNVYPWPWQLKVDGGEYLVNGNNASSNTSFDINTIFKNLNTLLTSATKDTPFLKTNPLLDTEKITTKESRKFTPKEIDDLTKKNNSSNSFQIHT